MLEKLVVKALVMGAIWACSAVTFSALANVETLNTDPKLRTLVKLKNPTKPKVSNKLPVSLQVRMPVIDDGTYVEL